jgi:hypothetical protein
LLTGSPCKRKFWFTAVAVPLLKADAVKFIACEFFPPAAVAVPEAGRLNSSPMLTEIPLSVIFEGSILHGAVNFVTLLAVPVPSLVTAAHGDGGGGFPLGVAVFACC